MTIRSSAAIRKNYTGVREYSTKNDEDDLVVMDTEAFYYGDAMQELRGNLAAAAEDRKRGIPGLTVGEAVGKMKQAIKEARTFSGARFGQTL
jgi:hypothetical protein